VNLERARELMGQLVRWRLYAEGIGDVEPPFPDATLLELLQAEAVCRENRAERQPDGSTKIKLTVDPRGIAAAWVLRHYEAQDATDDDIEPVLQFGNVGLFLLKLQPAGGAE
jgi:hypothetical protein